MSAIDSCPDCGGQTFCRPDCPSLSCPRCGGTEITSKSGIAGWCVRCGFIGFLGEPTRAAVPPETTPPAP